MIGVIILCLILLVLSVILSKNNILSPGVVTNAVWLVCLLLFIILPHKLPPLSIQFLGSLSIWITLLCLSSLLMQSVHFKAENIEPSKFVRDIFFWVSVLTFPSFLLFVKEALALGETGNWAMDLRLAALGKTSHFKEIYGGLHVIIWQVSYLIELFFLSKKNYKRVIVLTLILLSFAFLTMAKAAFLEFFIKTICILYFRKKVHTKHILIGLAALFLLFGSLQAMRQSTKAESVDNEDFAILYLLSSMSAYDTLKPASSTYWGENVFRFYYSAAYKIGLIQNEPPDTILPFIKKPIATNTYTGMYPFFKDFGYWGIVVFAIILGLLYGVIFKKAQRGSPFYTMLYAVFIQFIIMQYVADMFITALLAYVKLIILLSVSFWIAKYRVFSREKFIQRKL